MFSKIITTTTLCSEAADCLFEHINAHTYNSDTSFIATARALLAPRLSEGGRIEIVHRGYMFGNEVSVGDWMLRPSSNRITVVRVDGSDTGIQNAFACLDGKFLSTHPDYRELEDLKVYMKKYTDARFYISESNKGVYVFIKKLNVRYWHFIQTLLPRLLPWYFKDNPLTDEEKDLIRSLSIIKAETYESLIEEFAKKYDFRSAKIKNMFRDFVKNQKAAELANIQQQIRNEEYNMMTYAKKYQELIESIAQKRTLESGIAYQVEHAESDDEITDFFISTKNINPIEVGNNHIKIIIESVIANYDPDLYEAMYNNDNSYLFKGYEATSPVFASFEARKKFINAVFGEDAVLKIKVVSYYDLDLRGRVSTIKKYAYPKPQYKNCLINPHFEFFACLGNNEGEINALLRKGETILAIMQCMASAQNLNLSEGRQTVAPFLEHVFDRDCARIILMPDGTSKTPAEAYQWLLEQENKTEE